VVDSKRYVVALHEAFVARGGVVKRTKVTGFFRDGGTIVGVQTRAGTNVSADQIVVAAGAWSRHLAAELGLHIQLQGVIGYQTSLQDPGIEVGHALIYAKGGFGITPYESGLAVAGSIEFADLGAKPNWKRADILVEKAKRVLPGLRAQPAERRFGRRPLTPDTKPIIGRTPTAQNVIFATGHGQLGLTLGATTGRLVSDIVASRGPNIDMSGFRPERF
jgi:D-amino-acid dehydrogenase